MQVQESVKRTNDMLALTIKGFEYRGKDILRSQLHMALVRSHLEYYQFWSSYFKSDILANKCSSD